jgi:tRNA G10  N-methylase Trm11
MEFIFKLGFSGKLAELELASVLGYSPIKISESEYKLSLSGIKELNKVANRLGGLISVTYADSGKIAWRHSSKYWKRMDRGKPYVSARKGLLPPKIARQMVNIAIGPEINPNKILVDPFCGSGTILLEASSLGLKVVGADQDKKQLAGAEKNLRWAGYNFKLILTDATKISDHLQTADYFVSEPFMGKTRYSPLEIGNIAKGLSKLYLGALKNWHKVLKPGGRVVMTFPIFTNLKNKVVTGDIVDHSSLSGYNIVARDIYYSRPNAQITREIIILEKK